MSTRVILPNKYRSEILPVVFDFTSVLPAGDTISGSPICSMSVYLGVDATPNAMVGVAATVSGGTKVTQNVQNGVVGVTYVLRCAVATVAGWTLIMDGFLTVLPDQP